MNNQQFLEWLENNYNVNNWYESKRADGDKVIIVILDGEDLDVEDISNINKEYFKLDKNQDADIILTTFLDDLRDALDYE